MAKFREEMNKTLKRFLDGGMNRESQIKTEDFEEYLYILQEELRLFHQNLGNLTIKQLGIIQTMVAEVSKDTKLKGVSAYKEYRKKLQGKASKAEAEVLFSSLIFATKNCEKLIENLIETYSSKLQKKVITVNNTKVTDMAVMGAVTRVSAIAEFAVNIFTSVSINISDPTFPIPGYRIARLTQLNDAVAGDISKLYQGIGLANLDRDLKNIKKKNSDVKIVDEDNTPVCQFIGNLVPDSVSNLLTGIFHLNIFRWLGEAWINYRQGIYLKQEDEREWIKNHVNLLRLQVAENADKEDKDKLLKIISNYDAKVARLDSQISEYKEGI